MELPEGPMSCAQPISRRQPARSRSCVPGLQPPGGASVGSKRGKADLPHIAIGPLQGSASKTQCCTVFTLTASTGVSDRNAAVSDSVHHAPDHSPQGVSDTIFDDDQFPMASTQRAEGGLISAVFDAIRCLPASKQAAILLDTSLALIEAGQCGVLRLCFLEL